MKPSLVFMMRPPGRSPGVLLRFRVGGFGGRGGGSSGFLTPFGFPLLFLLGPRLPFGLGGGSRLGLQLGLGGADLLGAPLLVADPEAGVRRRLGERLRWTQSGRLGYP